MESNEYSNNWSRRIFTFLSTLILIGLSIYLVTFLLISLNRWITGNAPPKIITTIVGLVLAVIICSFMAAIFANLQPNVRVSDKGLAVQIFLFWWYLIPWEDIKDIRSVPMIGRYRLVIVRKLTFIHRFIGTMYFAFFQPAFLISSEIDNYDELIHLIKKKIGKELWE